MSQAWVRHLPIGEVATYAEQVYQQEPRAEQPRLFEVWKHYQYRAQQEPTLRPFAHPYYWAAFAVNGV